MRKRNGLGEDGEKEEEGRRDFTFVSLQWALVTAAPGLTAWENCPRLLGLVLLPLSGFTPSNCGLKKNITLFLSFLWAYRVKRTRVEVLITPAMMRLCPLRLRDPCQYGPATERGTWQTLAWPHLPQIYTASTQSSCPAIPVAGVWRRCTSSLHHCKVRLRCVPAALWSSSMGKSFRKSLRVVPGAFTMLCAWFWTGVGHANGWVALRRQPAWGGGRVRFLAYFLCLPGVCKE